MQNIRNELKQIKESLHDDDSRNDEDFQKLVRLSSNIDDELFETLILIHSNYKADLQSLRNKHIRSLVKVIDNNIDMVGVIKEYIDNKQATKSKPSTSSKVIIIMAGAMLLLMLIPWAMYTLDSDATKWSGEFILNLTNIIKDIK